MKRLFLTRLTFSLLITSVLMITGCGKGGSGDKDGGTPEYYISFKANGVQKKYTGQAIASLGHSAQDGLYNAVLQGYKATAADASKEHIGIAIFNNSAVSTGTYQDPQKATNNTGDEVPKVLISYMDTNGNGYLTMGGMVDKNGNINSFPGSENIVANAKVSVTKLTGSYIEGTFSGTAFLSTDANFKTKVSITEGKFILKAYRVN